VVWRVQTQTMTAPVSDALTRYLLMGRVVWRS
jgi:hypothetical protein